MDKHTTLPVKWMSIESLLDGYFDEKTDVVRNGIYCCYIQTRSSAYISRYKGHAQRNSCRLS